MLRPRLLLAAAFAALPIVPAGTAAAAAPAPPTVLPAVNRTVVASATTAQRCDASRRSGRGLTSTVYRAPMSGYLDVRLRGRGDWDLLLRDARSGRRLAASQAFGGREVAQTWIGAGDRVVAQACRRRGAARSAAVGFRLVDVRPPAEPAGRPSLVRVTGSDEKIEALEGLGLDVTHARGRGWADVLVAGTDQMALLQRSGLDLTTRVADMRDSFAQARKADRAYSLRAGAAGSPLPSGRTEYRAYADYQTELKALVDQHPGLVRPVTLGKSFQGRELSGVEIARDVNAADGRPTFFLMGVHHAREWPSGEAAMEFAHLLAETQGDARIDSLLARERVVILPIVNPDGFVSSRGSFDPGDATGQDPNVTLVEAIAPPGGAFAYRRKNCDGELGGPETPCELTWGVDNNRNYGNLWGGPGSSSDVTSQSYHGPGPRSEPETQAVWNYARTHNVTTLISLHNVAALVLRPPGLHDGGLAPDEPRMKEIGDAMGDAAGYTSQFSWQLYDTAGTTEDDTYAATGGYGYTIEMGPPDGQFHMPYETGVVKEWTGDNAHAKGRGGMREALLVGAESAASERDLAILRGTAPGGNVLRLRKSFDTVTSPYCQKGIEPIVNVGLPKACVTGAQDPLTLHDSIDQSTTVPGGGTFDWYINQSTRPFVNGGAVKEELHDVQPPLATFKGSPGAPQSTVDHEFTLPADQPAEKLKIDLVPTGPEDYDIEVFRKEADGSLTKVGSSGNLPGMAEHVVLDRPSPGAYVVRVVYYAGATGAYDVTVTRATATRTTTTGHKEAYDLTCESPDGRVLEQHSLVIDRGQSVTVNLGCGTGPSTFADGTPLGGPGGVGSTTPSVDGTPAPVASRSAGAAGRRTAAARRAAAKRRAAKVRARKLATCRTKARRINRKAKRNAALRSCAKRYGSRAKRAQR